VLSNDSGSFPMPGGYRDKESPIAVLERRIAKADCAEPNGA
jgi:hypothetical protein